MNIISDFVGLFLTFPVGGGIDFTPLGFAVGSIGMLGFSLLFLLPMGGAATVDAIRVRRGLPPIGDSRTLTDLQPELDARAERLRTDRQ